MGGEYRMAMGKVVSTLLTTVVRIDTDTKLSGYGEVCPLGSNYLPAFAGGVIPGLQELAPHLLGQDPLNIGHINQLMDGHLKGHLYLKSPIDVACWDLLGKASGQPVHTLLGGCFQQKLPLYFSLSNAAPEVMVKAASVARAKGYRQFQIKLGGDVEADIECVRRLCRAREQGEIFMADANQGFSQHEAVRFVHALRDVDVYIEQPCDSLDNCLAVRQKSVHPFKLDESIHNLESLLAALSKQAMDVVCVKISKLGGLSKAKLVRDICAACGLVMTVEDSWGSDIVTAALSHLAASTPVKAMLNTTDLNNYMMGHIATGTPKATAGFLEALNKPGLGIEPAWDILGDPVFIVRS